MMATEAPAPDPDQLDLFTGAAIGAALGDEGAARALTNTSPAWRQRAENVMAHLINNGATFTADDITRVAGPPPNPNAMGGLFKAHRGLLRRVGYTAATRRAAHGRALAVWQGRDAHPRPSPAPGAFRPLAAAEPDGASVPPTGERRGCPNREGDR